MDNELPFRLVLFWEPTEIVLDILEKSILQCSQKLDLGLLHPNIKILLLSKSKKQLQSLLATKENSEGTVLSPLQAACLPDGHGSR